MIFLKMLACDLLSCVSSVLVLIKRVTLFKFCLHFKCEDCTTLDGGALLAPMVILEN